VKRGLAPRREKGGVSGEGGEGKGGVTRIRHNPPRRWCEEKGGGEGDTGLNRAGGREKKKKWSGAGKGHWAKLPKKKKGGGGRRFLRISLMSGEKRKDVLSFLVVCYETEGKERGGEGG